MREKEMEHEKKSEIVIRVTTVRESVALVRRFRLIRPPVAHNILIWRPLAVVSTLFYSSSLSVSWFFLSLVSHGFRLTWPPTSFYCGDCLLASAAAYTYVYNIIQYICIYIQNSSTWGTLALWRASSRIFMLVLWAASGIKSGCAPLISGRFHKSRKYLSIDHINFLMKEN